MNSPSPASSSLLFYSARVVVGKEVPERSKLARLLAENGAFCISGSAPIADLKFPTPVPFGELYFLLDSFTGETFEDLKRKGAKIIGPQVVYDSLRLQKPLPAATHPVFCRTLDGMHITSTGFQARKKAEIEVLVQYMNGSYCKDLTTSIDCLIAAEVGSEKYQVATLRNIPVVCYNWIVQAWKSQTQPSVKSFALPPLSGLVICVTGLRPDTRVHIRKLVSANGGRYSADLTRHCTHLLAENPAGDKFRYAAVWRIPAVTTDWLFDCVNYQAYQDVSRYLVCPNPAAATSASFSELPHADFIHSSAVLIPTSLSASSASSSPHCASRSSVPLSPSPSESFIVHTSPAGQRRRTSIHRQNMLHSAFTPPSSSPVAEASPMSPTLSSSGTVELVPPAASSSSSSASSPVMAQLQALYRSVSDLCYRLQQNLQQEAVGRELTHVLAQIETMTASLFSPHTAAALFLSADHGNTPAFRNACIRYITEHFPEVRATPSYHALPARLQYELEAASLLQEHPSAAVAAAAAATGTPAAVPVATTPIAGGAASPVSASSSSLPDIGSPGNHHGGSESSAGSKRRRIS